MTPELRNRLFKKQFKKLPKYDDGGGYPVNMGGMSTGSMVSGGIGAVSSMIPEGQVYNPQGNSMATDQDALDKQNTRTDRLNKSSKGLASAASTAAMIPGVGWIAGGVLGLASLGTKIGAKASAKKAGAMETVTYMKDGGYSITNLPNNMASFRYDNGGKLINFKGNSHEEGGIPLDQNMKVNPLNPTSEVENGETGSKELNYIFSDTLKPMDNKRTFASISKSIDGKYKDKIDPIAKASKNRELARLAQSNETMRLVKEAKNNPLKKNGGSLPKYENGSPFVEDYNRDGLTYLNSIGYGNTLSLPNNPFDSPELGNIKRVNSVPGLSIGSPFALPQEQAYDGTNYPIPSTTYNANKQSNPLTTSNKVNPTTGDYLQFGAGALSGITNLAMGLKKPEKYNPLTSQYFNSGLRDMDQKARFNPNEILMNRNVGMNQINQGSSSNATRMANLQGLFRGTNTQLGQLAEKENLANIGIKQNLGQAKIGVGAQDLAAQERARGLNIQSKATAQNLRKTGLEQIYGSIGSLGQLQNQSKLNTQQLNVLNSLAKNYGVSPETMMIMFKNGLVQLPK